jgi:DNA repair protein SbcD/Mre11
MKYAHLADLHLGSWRDQKMRDLSTNAFLTAIDQCITQQVDFILFAGDIFNTSLPAVDTLKLVTKKLKELEEKNIPLYVIAGSHDFSPSGKTMIDVLENAGLLKNVCKGNINEETKELHLNFTVDKKTGTKITGILGKKGQLDKMYYQNLHLQHLEQEEGYKIFMFHTSLTELKPKHLELMESYPASFLPKSFNYYAGGHIHHKSRVDLPEYGTLTYPGALFPNNFAEVEKYSHGGYYIVTVENGAQEIEWVPVEVVKHNHVFIDCHRKTPEVVGFEIVNQFNNIDLTDTLITIRLAGMLERGKVSDINFKEMFKKLYDQGAYFIMKNTAKLTSEEFEEIKIAQHDPETVEEEVIKEHLQQVKLFDKETELHLTKSLLTSLNTIKKEGETMTDFHARVEGEIMKLLETS